MSVATLMVSITQRGIHILGDPLFAHHKVGPWMYWKNWIPDWQYGGAPIILVATQGAAAKKNPLPPNAFFPQTAIQKETPFKRKRLGNCDLKRDSNFSIVCFFNHSLFVV